LLVQSYVEKEYKLLEIVRSEMVDHKLVVE
jgi:hypothetical protein